MRAVTFLSVLALTGGGALAAGKPTPEQLMTQLLIASDLADACPAVVQRREGRDPHRFVADGVIQIINENDVTMTDLVKVQNTASPDRMLLLKRDELRRRGVDYTNRRDVCFFARQIVGSDDRIGRYLEAR